eukprot:c21947_g1_i6.p1 GENE.c21947_g1_i6~~c21947_g1_i6.p1  ORF type:complete len:502 (+),score=154.44 c21947_g1_i6:537-2042(+)
MVHQYQFVHGTSYQSGDYPTGYRGTMHDSSKWSYGNVGLYSEKSKTQTESGKTTDNTEEYSITSKSTRRKLKDIDQQPTNLPSYQDYSPEMLFINTFAFLALAVAAIIVLFITYLVMKKKYAHKFPAYLSQKLIRWKLIAMGIRLLSMSYFPVSFVALYQLLAGSNKMVSFFAVAALVIITLTFPLVTASIFSRKNKMETAVSRRKASLPTQKRKDLEKIDAAFGPLFEDYKRHTQWFSMVILAKMLLNALILAFLSDLPVFQSYCMLILCGGYLFAIALKPFKDKVNERMELYNTCCDLISVTVPVIFAYVSLEDHRNLIQWILLAIQGSVTVIYLVIGIYNLNKVLKTLKLKFERMNLSMAQIRGNFRGSVKFKGSGATEKFRGSGKFGLESMTVEQTQKAQALIPTGSQSLVDKHLTTTEQDLAQQAFIVSPNSTFPINASQRTILPIGLFVDNSAAKNDFFNEEKDSNGNETTNTLAENRYPQHHQSPHAEDSTLEK